MKDNGFTLIELLAVIVILAIIALIATPIILNIISDSKNESNKRSIEMYADALKNSIARYQLDGTKLEINRLKIENGKQGREFENSGLKVEYNGNVECDTIIVFKDGSIFLADCKVNGNEIEYIYGSENIPEPKSFEEDDWEVIVANSKVGNLDKYNVGSVRKISLEGFPNKTYTIRIANTSTPSECNAEGFSQTACGLVIEFVDVIANHQMNLTASSIGGWKDSEMRKYVNSTIYNSLPEELRRNIIDTIVISGHESGKEKNYKTTDKIYLLSSKEVWGDSNFQNKAIQTRQLDYYNDVKTNNSSKAIKKYKGNSQYWWLRSVNSSSTSAFTIVITDGSYSQCTANVNYGVAPAFRIG